MIIDGKAIAAGILEDIKKMPVPKKELVFISVGKDPASLVFLKQKERVGRIIGIKFKTIQFSANVKTVKLKSAVREVSNRKSTGGVVIQLPLPESIEVQEIFSVLDPRKDPDSLTLNSDSVSPAILAVQSIFERASFSLKNAKVSVVGRGLLIGKPISLWFMDKVRELHIFGSRALRSESAQRILSESDLIVSGVGKAGIIQNNMLPPAGGVIDFGCSLIKVTGKTRLYGDLDLRYSDFVDGWLSFYTPTPGGTGPILIAALFKNFYELRQ